MIMTLLLTEILSPKEMQIPSDYLSEIIGLIGTILGTVLGWILGYVSNNMGKNKIVIEKYIDKKSEEMEYGYNLKNPDLHTAPKNSIIIVTSIQE